MEACGGWKRGRGLTTDDTDFTDGMIQSERWVVGKERFSGLEREDSYRAATALVVTADALRQKTGPAGLA